MAISLKRDAAGRILKRTSAQAKSPIIEAAVEEADQAKPVSDPLREYRSQARELQQALAAVKEIHQQTAAVTQQREAVLQQRKRLLNSFEDESAVAELSKLASRVEMHGAKLDNLGGQLANAQADLKIALAAFATSFNNLFGTLRTFLVNKATANIRDTVHPAVRIISGLSIAQVAALATEVVDFEQLALRIDPMAAMLNNPFPENTDNDVLVLWKSTEREADRAVPKADPLLAEAAKHVENGFVPPLAFDLAQWRANVNHEVPIAA